MIEGILAAYAGATVAVVFAALVGYSCNEHQTNPIAYVFWPLIALNAAARHIYKTWSR